MAKSKPLPPFGEQHKALSCYPGAREHPLTDEMCDSIAPWPIKRPGEYDCMRTAAEWQLIQVIEFIKKEDTVYADYIKQAMRTQQQEESRSNLLPDSSITFNKAENEIIRIDAQGFHYRGQFIEDAGEAHRLLVEFLRKEQESN